jgi:hypothetical protein
MKITKKVPYTITHPGPHHIGVRLTKKLDTHRWHVLYLEYEDDTDLDELEKQVVHITAGLQVINEDDTDLDELEKQVSSITESLETIND